MPTDTFAISAPIGSRPGFAPGEMAPGGGLVRRKLNSTERIRMQQQKRAFEQANPGPFPRLMATRPLS